MSRTLLKKGSLLLIEGLNVSQPAEYIRNSSSPNTKNFFVDRDLLTKRAGTTELGSTLGEECMSGVEFYREGTNYNIRIGLTKIQKYDTGTTSWADIGNTIWTGTSDDLFDIATPLSSGKQILVVTNGIDPIRKWTGSGNDSNLNPAGLPPVAKFIQEYQTYLVAANIQGGVDVDTRVQWSDTADPEDWSTGNYGAKDLEEDGGAITGLNIFGNYLAVHKQTSIYLGYLISTSAIFRFERKPTGAGTCANGSIVNLPTGEQIFLSTDGLRIFNGATAPIIESPVNDEIRDGLNSAYRHKAWGLLVKELDEVWIGVPIGSQTSGETVYKFNYVTRVVYKDSRTSANCAWKASQSNSITWDDASGTWDSHTDRWDETSLTDQTPLIYIGDTTGKTVYVNSLEADDDGVAVDAFWETKDFEDEEKRLCRWEQLEVWARGGSLTVEYSIDEGVTWVETTGSPYTLTDSFPSYDSPIIFYFDVISSKIRFRLRNNESGESLVIKQYIVGYKLREYRK